MKSSKTLRKSLSLSRNSLSLAAGVAGLGALLVGCSSASESRQAGVPISARPAGSVLTVQCAEGKSATPSPGPVPGGHASEKCSVTASHPGYEPASAIVTRVATTSSAPVSVVLTLQPQRPPTGESLP